MRIIIFIHGLQEQLMNGKIKFFYYLFICLKILFLGEGYQAFVTLNVKILKNYIGLKKLIKL